ncbi:MAG: hypothetical protein ACI4TW_00520, partial [Prevotella sp.]
GMAMRFRLYRFRRRRNGEEKILFLIDFYISFATSRDAFFITFSLQSFPPRSILVRSSHQSSIIIAVRGYGLLFRIPLIKGGFIPGFSLQEAN